MRNARAPHLHPLPASAAAAQVVVPAVPTPPVAGWAARMLATIASLGTAPAWPLLEDDPPLFVPAVFLAVAALLLHLRAPWAQIFVRGTWWSSLVVGAVISACAGNSERVFGAWIAVGAGLALVAVGRRWLAPDDDTIFAARDERLSRRARALLSIVGVLVVSEAQSLVFYGALHVEKGDPFEAGVAFAAATAIVVGGLLAARLGGRGLAAHVVLALGVAAVLCTDVLDLPWELVLPMVLALVAQAPLGWFLGRAKEQPPEPPADDARRPWPLLVVVAIMATAALAGLLLESGLGDL
jgi:hypothetical protein